MTLNEVLIDLNRKRPESVVLCVEKEQGSKEYQRAKRKDLRVVKDVELSQRRLPWLSFYQLATSSIRN